MDAGQPKDDSGHDSRNQGKSDSVDTPTQTNPSVGGYGAVPALYSGLPTATIGTASSPRESDSLLGNASRHELNEEHAEGHHPRKRTRWERLFDLMLDRMETYWPPTPPPPPPTPQQPPTAFEQLVNALIVCTLLIGLVIFLKRSWDELTYVCVVDDIKVSHLSLSFDPNDYKNFSFQLDQGNTGNIFVGQSYNHTNPNITIQVTARASSAEILQAFALDYSAIPQLSLMEANAYLNMTSAQARQKALRKGCTLVRVDILFPTNMASYDSLWIHHRERGNVNVRMIGGRLGGANHTGTSTGRATEAGEAAAIVIDRLDIRANAGWVRLQDVVVSSELSVVSRLGGIDGQVDVENRVVMHSAEELTLELGSSSPNLDLKVTSKEKARVVVKTQYSGHVSLTTTSNVSAPDVFVPRSKFVKQKKTAHSLIGYVPDSNGDEPGYLPHIEVSGKASVVELLG
ncbi:hypothetical protein BGZ95_003288 [Linnemannia exigua]|uniref:Uncharacterized protein n=1 Tax=Linnemannia exigua TaxID=604196 RepID=A0AAD4D4G9_9FUNG|nr:hypothetical protein BGZ95_003288 [Linnemannia exigua]